MQSQLLNSIIERQFDGAVIANAAQLRPGCPLAGQRGLEHEVGGGVFKDVWELRVGNFGEDVNVSAVALAHDGADFGKEVGQYAELG